MLLAALLVACVPADAPEPEPDPLDTAAPLLVPEPVTPVLDAAELDAAVQIALDEHLYLPTELTTWMLALLDDLEGGVGGGCAQRIPSVDDPDEWTYTGGGTCVGERYTVSGELRVDARRVETDGRLDLSVLQLYSLLGESLPDGAPVRAGGQGVVAWEEHESETLVRLTFGGAFLDGSSPGPLGSGVSGSLKVEGALLPGRGFVGTLAGPVGGGASALAFDDLSFVPECSAPRGAFALRDPSGGWWTVPLADDCSGCGPALFAGVERGTSCAGAAIQDALLTRLEAFAEAG